MREDYYAFNGLPKDKVERARNFERRNWPKINVDNKDWEIIINTKDPSQDPDLKKITICFMVNVSIVIRKNYSEN